MTFLSVHVTSNVELPVETTGDLKILRIAVQNAQIEFPQTFSQESPLETI